METLRRLRVGPFRAENAVRLEAAGATARQQLLPMETAVAELPHCTLSADPIRRLRNGQVVPVPAGSPIAEPDQEVAVFDPEGRLAAVVRVTADGKAFQTEKVLAAPRGG